MMKILYSKGSNEQVMLFYKRSKEERLKDIEGMEKAYEKKQAGINEEMSKHQVQRQKPKVRFIVFNECVCRTRGMMSRIW